MMTSHSFSRRPLVGYPLLMALLIGIAGGVPNSVSASAQDATGTQPDPDPAAASDGEAGEPEPDTPGGAETPRRVFAQLIQAQTDHSHEVVFRLTATERRGHLAADMLRKARFVAGEDEDRQTALATLLEGEEVELPRREQGRVTFDRYRTAVASTDDLEALYVALGAWIVEVEAVATEEDEAPGEGEGSEGSTGGDAGEPATAHETAWRLEGLSVRGDGARATAVLETVPAEGSDEDAEEIARSDVRFTRADGRWYIVPEFD